MKTLIIAIIFVLLLALGGFFALKIFQSKAAKTGSPASAITTLTGTLQPITGNPEYSEVVTVNGKTTGVASTHLDLTPYEGKNVKITGQYSGTTMYADNVVIVP